MTGLPEPSRTTSPPQFELEDLVVALHDRDQVLYVLSHEYNVTPRNVRTDDALGLALLEGLQGLPALVRPPTAWRQEDKPAWWPARTDIDVLLENLREYFARQFNGWVPAMGKNREVTSVVAAPGGGGSRTLAVGNPEIPAEPPAPRRRRSSAGSGVRIGILDALVYPHRRLEGHVAAEELLFALADLRSHGPAWRPWEGHATLVADIALQQAPAAELVMRAVLSAEHGNATAFDTARNMMTFAGAGIDILNLSLGCRTLDGQPPFALAWAVDRLSPEVLVVAAAGNHGDRTGAEKDPVYPAALPDVVAVGATERPGSQFSPKLPWVTCTAPGLNITGAYLAEDVLELDEAGRLTENTTRFPGYARWSGTSFAAAHVSGAIAAAMEPGKTAREALDTLLAEPNGTVRRYVYEPEKDA